MFQKTYMKQLQKYITVDIRTLLLIIAVSAYCVASGCVSDAQAMPAYPAEDTLQDDIPHPLYYPEIIKIDSEDEIGMLESQGVIILRRRGSLLLAYIPADDSATRSGGNIRKVRIRNKPSMDVARTHYNAADIHSGKDFPSAYTGRGVVVGLCDIGFDPSHPTFLKSDGNGTRIARIVQYKESEGKRTVIDDYGEMLEWKTDDPENTHATHVAGIMAGAYRGNEYWGMAPDAEIVATCSELSDVGLLAGVEDIIEYAHSVGKPAVVNLSMGNYTGPHDGTSYFCQYLDLLGEEAVICLSAGNEGSKSNTLPFDFNTDRDSVHLRIADCRWTQFEMYGITDIWSADDSPFSASLCIYDEDDNRIVHEFPIQEFSNNREWTVSSDISDDSYSEAFSKYYDGAVRLTGKVNEDNSRFNISMEYNAKTSAQSRFGPWALYNLPFIIRGKEGSHADIYADGQYSFLKGIPGGPQPGHTLSFSDLATGRNTVSVGMYVNRTVYPEIDKGENNSEHSQKEVCHHSGYSTLIDNRIMPITVAPGCAVISAASSPYLEIHPEEKGGMAAVEEFSGKDYHWYVNSGTSMSSPYVAGTIATWLEANPSLGIKDIQQIITESNRHDYPDPDNPRHGMGWFDPCRGLRLAISRNNPSGITSADADGKGIALSYRNGSLSVFNPGSVKSSIEIFTADGVRVLHSYTDGTVTEIPLTNLSKGIYLVRSSSGSFLKIIH